MSELCRRSRKIENIVCFCKKEALGRHWRTAEKKPSGGRIRIPRKRNAKVKFGGREWKRSLQGEIRNPKPLRLSLRN